MMYMKSKKVYIGISIGAILVICIIVASIFYIKTKNKDVEQADFTKNITNEDTKEAMEITEEKDEAKEITNEVKSEEADQGETKQEEVKKDNTKQKETKKVEEKKEIIVTDMKKTLYVKATSLNVRSGPSTSDSKIGAYKNAAEVTVTGKVKDSVAGEDRSQSFTAFATNIPSLNDACYLFFPRHSHSITRDIHIDEVLVGFSQSLDELVLSVW